MSPYFQVGQHIRSNIVLNAIITFLSTLPNGFNYSHYQVNPDNNTPSISMGDITNKRTDVRVLSINNIDTLYDYLTYFLLNLTFQSRKEVDFHY